MESRRRVAPLGCVVVNKRVHISIVSHGHSAEVARLLSDLDRLSQFSNFSVLLVQNLAEDLSFVEQDFSFPLRIHRNPRPKGFAENNNQAFRLASPAPDDYFCLINPDVRIQQDVFSPLIDCIEQRAKAGVVAPLIRDSRGAIEDSARRLPGPLSILGKAVGIREKPLAVEQGRCQPVDWVAGMFMLFPAGVYAAVGGFDERYFLYYEDVDLCCRLRLAGYQVFLAPAAVAVHDGRRDSHRRPAFFLRHLRSMVRFFLSPSYFWCRFKPRADGKKKGTGGPL
jgi:N-acetylglucosaminyl-diphospho-decaprenol L-rhamnosyltransferase